MRTVLLRKWQGRLTAFLAGGGGFGLAGGASTPAPLGAISIALCLMLVPILLMLGAIAALAGGIATPHAGVASHLAPVAFAAFGITTKTRTDLDKIIADAEAIEKKYEGKPIPEDEGKKLDELYAEGEKLSKEIEAEAARQKSRERLKGARRTLDEVPDPAVPSNRQTKGADDVSPIAGYTTPGHLVVLSEAYKKSHGRGDFTGKKNRGMSVEIPKSLLGLGRHARGDGLIALNHDEAKALGEFAASIETKDLPVLGEYVIAPNRTDRFVQATRPDTLTLRDILNVSPTSSPVIQWLKEVTYTEGADVQSEGTTAATTGSKPDADVEYSLEEDSVKTIAVTIPVTEQQLSDAPALINRINTRLLWDLRKKEEQLCGYGDGSALQFAGFFDSGTNIDSADDRAAGGDSLLDIIRRGMTDIMTDEYQPNFVWMHPIDWEEVELLKGSDGHYVWAIIRDELGPRVWSVRVVQGVGTKKKGNTTRNLLIGDTVGAVLYDKQESSIAVGYIDDQFAKNLRTIRAEMRSLLVIESPKAFRIYETAS